MNSAAWGEEGKFQHNTSGLPLPSVSCSRAFVPCYGERGLEQPPLCAGFSPSSCQLPAKGELGENQLICCFLPAMWLRGMDTSCAKPSVCQGAGAAPAAALIRFYARGAGLAGRLPALSSPPLCSWRSSGMFVPKAGVHQCWDGCG